MVSRKKAKGKARKAAAKAKAGEEFAAFKPFSLTQFKKSSCTHGSKTSVPVFDAAEKTATKHKYPEIWKDSTKLEWIASAFVSIGVEAIIREDDEV
eukprot:scaffold17447_cov73-Skeletonema_marinoi.AAC.1